MRTALASSLAVLAAFVACTGSDPEPATPPEVIYVEAGATSSSSSGTSGAAVEAGTGSGCSAAAPFGDVKSVPGTNLGAAQASLTLSANELHLYFNVLPARELYVSTRMSRDQPFADGTKVPGVGSNLSFPAVSPDELTLVYVQEKAGSQTLFVNHRVSTNVDFSSESLYPQDLVIGSSEVAERPKASNDAVFVNVGAIGETPSLVRAARNTSLVLDDAEKVPGSFDPDTGGFVITDGGLRAYFETSRGNAAGSFDIWTASRLTTAQPWENFTSVAGINTDEDETMGGISADGCRIYFTRGKTSPHLFVASKPKL